MTHHRHSRRAAAVAAVVALGATGCEAGGPGARPTPAAATSPGTGTPPATTPGTASPHTTPATTPSHQPAGPPLLAHALLDPADLPYGTWRETDEGTGFRETALDPCGDTAYPAQRARTDGAWRSLVPTQDGKDVVEGGGVSQDAHAYPTAAAAAEAEAGYRRALHRCRTHYRNDGRSRVEVTYTVLDEAPLLVERTYRTTSGPRGAHYPDYVGLVRYDDVVTIVELSFGEGPNRAAARRVTAAAAAELCAARRPDGPCS